ncbi:GATOR complex protein NPRL3 [Labeo rohita]|uniref:GATOR complex protein NPRL3 n=1 Tax=Labeo rohita TaxID=84645 RepID=A0ABQ8MW05_LABRO|nr:GATOR complex protein NPRL3 [Labeo rohita]
MYKQWSVDVNSDAKLMWKQGESSLQPNGEKTSPISVILVSSGSRGNKLLFRYPFQRVSENTSSATSKQRSPYVLNTSGDSTEDQDGDSRFSDSILATILATKSDMCGKKFELKIDNVRFVGHPTLLQPPHTIQVSKTDPSPKRELPTMILFSVVFALRANADASVINCMHNLSRRIAIALQHEERRCQYLTREAKLMLAVQDEVTTMTETDGTPQSPFRQILPKCKLARDLKEAYDSLCTTGVVRLHINNWLEVSFCLPHKIHRVGGKHIPPEALEHSLKAIRPYHALLLLDNEKVLLAQLPLDCSPALVRLIKTCSAVKNLQQLAQDADLALLQVFQIAAHLVYWGKAIIIYPLCENNVYMLSPHANICIYSPLAEQFALQFPGHDLPSMLAKFSLPAQLIQMVVWMLQHRLLFQLHTYVCLLVPPIEEEPGLREEEPPLVTRLTGRSLSTPSALSFGSPTSSDDMTLTSPSMDNSSAELQTGGDSPLNKRMTETLLASLTEHERHAILRVPAAQNPEDLRLFASVLVITNHEDPIISLFQSPPD